MILRAAWLEDRSLVVRIHRHLVAHSVVVGWHDLASHSYAQPTTSSACLSVNDGRNAIFRM